MRIQGISFLRRAAELAMVLYVGFFALPASAGDLKPQDQKRIVEVVQAQLSAFAQDDAVKAFSFAAPNIQQMVGTAENFIEMVRNNYEVVYRPASTAFSQPKGTDMQAALRVQMTDEAGSVWVAIYGLQKQKNKTWRITGCILSKPTGTMI
jgi:hypothetical protein